MLRIVACRVLRLLSSGPPYFGIFTQSTIIGVRVTMKVPARESLDIDGVPHSEHYAKLDDSCASSRCKVTGPDLKSCSRCKMVHYCSAACQKADWKALHKKACYSRSYTPPAPAPVQSTAETSSSEGGGAAAAAATPPPPAAAATAAAPNSSGGSALAAACAPVANLPLQHPNN